MTTSAAGTCLQAAKHRHEPREKLVVCSDHNTTGCNSTAIKLFTAKKANNLIVDVVVGPVQLATIVTASRKGIWLMLLEVERK